MDRREPTRIKEQAMKKIILIALICLSVGIGFLISYFVGKNFLSKEIAIEEKQLLEAEEKQLVDEQKK